MAQTAYLLLSSGQVLEGKSFGAPLPEQGITGEVVFTTGMTGYLETLTDPSYYGQIVVQTFPLIGNYGVITPDFESDHPYLSAYIVRDWCRIPSNFRCEGDIDTFFKARNLSAVYDIDTRYLTQILREAGTMNGVLTSKDPAGDEALLKKVQDFSIQKAVEHASTDKILEFKPEGEEKFHIGFWDFGTKRNIIRCLNKRGCRVTLYPCSTKAETILKADLDGLMLGNGPGDPSVNTGIIQQIAAVCSDKQLPIFGICMGHQLLNLAHGATTVKLKYGHRGANQPVKDLKENQVYITSQNHGYAVEASSLPDNAKVRYVNANDGTCEGVDYLDCPQFSVQFHPEASAGPLDTEFIFDRFLSLAQERKEARGCR